MAFQKGDKVRREAWLARKNQSPGVHMLLLERECPGCCFLLGHNVSLSIPVAIAGIVPCSRPSLSSGRQRIVVNLRESHYGPMVRGYSTWDSASRGLNGMAIILPI